MRHGINVPQTYTTHHKSGRAVVAGLSSWQPRAVSAGVRVEFIYLIFLHQRDK